MSMCDEAYYALAHLLQLSCNREVCRTQAQYTCTDMGHRDRTLGSKCAWAPYDGPSMSALIREA